MELFVYNWFYTGNIVYGHCLDEDGNYRQVKITNFMPSCFVEGDTVPPSTVVPVKAEYKRMFSSKDVSSLRPFYRLHFRNANDMDTFSREQRGKCYMADIPHVTTFLSQVGVDHVGWIRTGSVANEIVGLPDRIPISSPRVMSFDIEVRSMDAGMPQPHRILDTVEMISVVVFGNNVPTVTYILHMVDKLDVTGCTNVMCDDEIDMITRFFYLIKSEDPTVITGYNIYGFDLHYLISRLKLRLVEMPNVSRGGYGNAMSVLRVDWSSDAYGHNNYDRLVIGGRVVIDMYLYFKRMKLDKYSLDFVSQKFLNEHKDDMPYATMAEAFRSGNRDELRRVAQYCIRDSVLVMNLFDKVKMWIDACEIAKITRCSIEDIYTRGEQMKMIAQCVAECVKRNIVMQPQPSSDWKPYEGAYVLDPVRGVYEGCSILDFQSLYPSIIIAYNICPSTYVSTSMRDCHVVGQHRFRKKPVGLLPGMIERILDERKTVKNVMKCMSEKTSVEYIVLDRRQNALKICANSVYGMMGFQKSRYFGHLGCAESVTTVGRELLADIVDRIDQSYPVEVIYGDSVTGYTPTLLRIDGKFVFIETFENIALKWGHNNWTGEDKESCELHNVEVWTEQGWTKVYRVIRHVLLPHKKIIRISTRAGLCDVTDEHSLLSARGDPVHAEDVEMNDVLLHHEYPVIQETEMSIRSPSEARIMGAFCGNRSSGILEHCISVVPQEILNSSLDVRKAFWDGVLGCQLPACFTRRSPCRNELLLSPPFSPTVEESVEEPVVEWSASACDDNQATLASFAMLASSIGYNVSLDTLRLTVTKNGYNNSSADHSTFDSSTDSSTDSTHHSSHLRSKSQSWSGDESWSKSGYKSSEWSIKKKYEIEYAGYVYDLTTMNNHFQAGPGKMIVHNTDSCMLRHKNETNVTNSIALAESICTDITASLPVPMALKFETYCDKVILLSKKRYILVSDGAVSYKGVMNARRDYCAYAKNTYSQTLQMVAQGHSTEKIADYIDKNIFMLLAGKVDMQDLIITKSLARKLSTYKVNQPHVVLAKRLVKKTGIDIPAGTRLEYVYVTSPDKMVTPDEFAEGDYTINAQFYVRKQLTTQIDDILSVINPLTSGRKLGNYVSDSWVLRTEK